MDLSIKPPELPGWQDSIPEMPQVADVHWQKVSRKRRSTMGSTSGADWSCTTNAKFQSHVWGRSKLNNLFNCSFLLLIVNNWFVLSDNLQQTHYNLCIIHFIDM